MQDQFITISEIVEYLRISRTTFWKIRKYDSTFPDCVPSGKKWRCSDIEAWLETKKVYPNDP